MQQFGNIISPPPPSSLLSVKKREEEEEGKQWKRTSFQQVAVLYFNFSKFFQVPVSNMCHVVPHSATLSQ